MIDDGLGQGALSDPFAGMGTGGGASSLPPQAMWR